MSDPILFLINELENAKMDPHPQRSLNQSVSLPRSLVDELLRILYARTTELDDRTEHRMRADQWRVSGGSR